MEENPHKKHRERVKKEFLARGFSDDTPDHKILEMLLFYSIPRVDTNEIAHALLNYFGSAAKVFEASVDELMKVKGIGENSAVLIKLMIPIIRMYNNDKLKSKKKFSSLDDIGEFLTLKYKGFTKEIFAITSLDNRGVIVGFDIVSEGDLSTVPVSMRSIIEVVIKRKATAIILSHNHPGGQAVPSKEDIKTTASICEAMKNMSVAVIDHCILCDDDYVSLAVSQSYRHMFGN